MSEQNERYRISHFRNGELPANLYDALAFRSQGDATHCLNCIAGVVDLIASHHATAWPGDEQWQAMLPAWLVRAFKTYTPEELTRIRADRSLWPDLAWQLGSWLDLLRNRGWEWWSARVNQDVITIVVRVQGQPYSAGPLRHLIEAAGGSVIVG